MSGSLDFSRIAHWIIAGAVFAALVSGFAMILIFSPFFDRTALPLVGAVAACALIAFVLALLTLRPQPEAQAPA